MLINKKKLRRLQRHAHGSVTRTLVLSTLLATAIGGTCVAPGMAQAAPTDIGSDSTWNAAAATPNPEGFILTGDSVNKSVTTSGNGMTGPGNVSSLTMTGIKPSDVKLNVETNLVITKGLTISGANNTHSAALSVYNGKTLTAGDTVIGAFGNLYVGEYNNSGKGYAILGSLTIANDGTLTVGGEGRDNDANFPGGAGDVLVLGDMEVRGQRQSGRSIGLLLGGKGGVGAGSGPGSVGGEGKLTVEGNFHAVDALTIGGEGGGGSNGNVGGEGGAGTLTLKGAVNTFARDLNLGGESGSASTDPGGAGGTGTLNLAGGNTTFEGTVNIGAAKGDAPNLGAEGNLNVYGGATALFEGDVQADNSDNGGTTVMRFGGDTSTDSDTGTGAGTGTLAAGATLSANNSTPKKASLLVGGKAGTTNGGEGTLNVYGDLQGTNVNISVGGTGGDSRSGTRGAQGGQGTLNIKTGGTATFVATQVIGGRGGDRYVTATGDGTGGDGILNIDADAGSVTFAALTVGGTGGDGMLLGATGGTGGHGIVNVYKKNQDFAGTVTLGGAPGSTGAGQRGDIGTGGLGTLHIFEGASANFSDTTTGVQIGAASAFHGSGEMYVHSGGAVSSAGDINVGSNTADAGNGLLHIADGGSVVVTDANKSVTIEGNGSLVSTQAYTVGNSGTNSGLTANTVNINNLGTLEVRGDLRLAAGQLGTDSSHASSGINLGTGSTLDVQGKFTLAETSAFTGSWTGRTVLAQHLDVNTQDFTLNGGTLNLLGTGTDFLTAKSMTITNSGTLTLGDGSPDAAPSGGEYDGKITVGSGANTGTLQVQKGLWAVQQLAVDTRNSSVTVNGHLAITDQASGALSVAASSNVDINQGGVLQAHKDALLNSSYASIIGGKLLVKGGAVLKIDGYTELSLTNAKTIATQLLKPTGTGLIDYGPLTVVVKPDDFYDSATHPLLAGTLKADKAEGSFVLLKDNTVGYATTGTTPTISTGGFGAKSLLVQTDSGASSVVISTTRDLTLIGDSSKPSEQLVGVTGASKPNKVKTHITVNDTQSLNLGSAGVTGGGTLNGNVTLTGSASSLNVTNGDYTVGNITGAQNAQINIVDGDLSASKVGASGAELQANISSGSLTASGPASFNETTLSNGTLETTGADGNLNAGEVIISGEKNALHASGNLKVTSFSSSQTLVDNALNNTSISVGGDMTLDSALNASNVTLNLKKKLTATDHNIVLDKGSQGNVATLALGSGTLSLDGDSRLALGNVASSGDITVEGASQLTVNSLDMAKTGNVLLAEGSSMQVTELTSATGKLISVGNTDTTGSTLVVDTLKSTGGNTFFVDAPSSSTHVKTVDKNELADTFIAGNNGVISLGQHNDGWIKEQTALTGLSPQSTLALALPLTLKAGGQLLVGEKWDAAGDWAGTPSTHAVDVRGNSLILADVTDGSGASLTLAGTDRSVNIDSTAGITLYRPGLQANQSYTLVAGIDSLVQQDITRTLVNGDTLQLNSNTVTNYMLVGTGFMFNKGSAANDGTLVAHTRLISAQSALPRISGSLGSFLDGMALNNGFNSYSTNAGVRFVSRALDRDFIGSTNVDLAAATLQGAAQTAAVAGVQGSTISIANASSGVAATRTSFAQPSMDTSRAVAVLQDSDNNLHLDGLSAGSGMNNGFGLWVMPMYQADRVSGMKSGSFSSGYNSDFGGVVLGADYTFDNAWRIGAALNVGGGHSRSKGDFNKTTNNYNFWGLSLYGGWTMNNFGLSADLGYTSAENDVKQALPAALGMDSLKSSPDNSVWTIGAKAEYKLEAAGMEIVPYIGVRYTGLSTSSYSAKSAGETVFRVGSHDQSVFTFPMGVNFAKTMETSSGWSIRPQAHLGIIPAAGDLKTRSTASIPSIAGSATTTMTAVDSFTFDGGLGLEAAKNNFTFGLHYNIQASQHRTGHGVFGTLRYEF